MAKKLTVVPIVKQEKERIELSTGECYICHTELEYQSQPVRTFTGDMATPCPNAIRICSVCRKDPKNLKEARVEAERHYQEDHGKSGLMV